MGNTEFLDIDDDTLDADVGIQSHERLECFFYSEAQAADRLGIHRTTLRSLALAGKAPVEAIPLTEHRRVYRIVDVHRLAGLEQ